MSTFAYQFGETRPADRETCRYFLRDNGMAGLMLATSDYETRPGAEPR